MNLQQLYYFQAISRLKNYTKAAEQLLVAQSSLSHSIGDLERELGVPLFFKVGRNIDITEYGKQFLIHVDRITAELELANQELKKMGAPVRLQPGRNEITEAEQQATRVGDTPDQAEGYGLLDTGTGSMEKVHVHRGRLEHAVNQVQPDGTVNMLAYVLIGGKRYSVQGDMLTEA